jgi:hypothetical protein
MLNYTEADPIVKPIAPLPSKFSDIAAQSGIQFIHKENHYNDFDHESLLPYKFSHIGPGLTTGDVNGDGLEDFFVGNAEGSPGALYLQNPEGRFSEQTGPWIADSAFEDTGSLIFDADGDGLQDILVVSGGNNITKNHLLNHRLYLNTGKGFMKALQAMPEGLNQSINSRSISCGCKQLYSKKQWWKRQQSPV